MWRQRRGEAAKQGWHWRATDAQVTAINETKSSGKKIAHIACATGLSDSIDYRALQKWMPRQVVILIRPNGACIVLLNWTEHFLRVLPLWAKQGPSITNGHMRFPLICCVLLTAFSAPAQAALMFDFSITNSAAEDPVSSFGVPGTMTGVIEGLADNSTGPASDILIESFPAGMQNLTGQTLPIDIATWTNAGHNSFTTSGGQIVGANFYAYSPIWLYGALMINDGDENQLSLNGFATHIANFDGLSGVTFTPAPGTNIARTVRCHRRRPSAP